MLARLYLCHSARALAVAGRNNYIPLAQESRLILPDGFFVGISGWSRDYRTPSRQTGTVAEAVEQFRITCQFLVHLALLAL